MDWHPLLSGLHIHAARGDAGFCVILGLFGLIALADLVHCRSALIWLKHRSEFSETADGKISRVRGWNLRRDLRAQFRTLSGAFIDRGVSVSAYYNLSKGDEVQLTYCRTDPKLVFLEPHQVSFVNACRRGVLFDSAWLVCIASLMTYLLFLS